MSEILEGEVGRTLIIEGKEYWVAETPTICIDFAFTEHIDPIFYYKYYPIVSPKLDLKVTSIT